MIHYLVSLDEMCVERPDKLANLIEACYQQVARTGKIANTGGYSDFLEVANDLHLIALARHLKEEKPVRCTEYMLAYTILVTQTSAHSRTATNALMRQA